MGSWRSVLLTECIERAAIPAKIPRKQFHESGQFPIVSQEKGLINGYWSDESAVIRVKSPLVVFGDHTQVLKYVDFDFVVGADGVRLLQPRPFLNAKYFYYFLMANPVDSLGYARHYRLLKGLDIRFPESLTYQERIAGILDEAFAAIATAIANAETNLANARELFESELNRIFRSPSAAVDIRDSGDGESADWPSTPIGDLFETITGSTPPKSKKEFYGDFIPFIKPPELTNGIVRHSADGLSELGAEQARVLPPESVLVSCIGILGKLGMNEAPVAFNQQINAIKPNCEAAYPRYVFYYCLSGLFRNCLHQLASGTTVSIVNKGKFNSIRIPIAPLPKQKQIAASLDELSASTRSLARIYEKKLTLLAELKQSILHKAFTGELSADFNAADVALSEGEA